jgi:3-hydroxyacyl-[acyl-carrier-protein] dehydratase
LEIAAKDILNILPHRYPFLLIDRVLEVEPGLRIVARKNVTYNEEYFVGHFPGEPVMPGVIQLEFLAQAAGVMLLLLPEHAGQLAFFAGIEKVRFRKPVVPGDTLTGEVTVLRKRATMAWVEAKASVDGVVVCEAEMSFALMPKQPASSEQSKASEMPKASEGPEG